MTPGPSAGIGIVDTLIGFPSPDVRASHSAILEQTRDKESRESFTTPVQYMFHDTPEVALAEEEVEDDPVAVTLAEMDRWGIAVGLVGVRDPDGPGRQAVLKHPDRFVGSWTMDPNDGVQGVRDLVEATESMDIRAITFFPCGTNPQIPIDDRRAYPYYSRAVELGLPVFCNAGIPGPRVPSAPQEVMRIDTVMYDFPDLVFVTRHGCEPWEDLAVKLMVKWPNLYYATTAFAPRFYPKAIIDYANTRGADRIMYGGYYPMGLSLERIVTEFAQVPFKDAVWPKFLRGNAAKVLGIADE
jgi:uncharacterized protein